MRTVSTDELPPRLDVLVASDDESRKHDHYNKYRGGVEWECDLADRQARMGCYSDMLKRMRGMLPAEWTVSKPEHHPDRNTTTAKIGPEENIDKPNMKTNMTEQKLRDAIRKELQEMQDEGLISENVGGVVSTGAINRNYSGYSQNVDKYTVADAQSDFGTPGQGTEHAAFASDEQAEASADAKMNDLFEYMTEVESALSNEGRSSDAKAIGKVRRALMSATA